MGEILILFLQVLSLMLVAGLVASGAYIAMGAWHRHRHPLKRAIDERPAGYEGNTGAVRAFYRGVKTPPVVKVFDLPEGFVQSHRGSR